MFRIFLAALVAVCFAVSSPRAQTCDQVDIHVLPFEVKEDFAQPHRWLAKRADDLGIVGAVITTSTIRVQGCDVVLGYLDPVLYVVRELTGNVCAHEHVLEHEREHVRIYRDHLSTLEKRISERAKGIEQSKLLAVANEELSRVRAIHAAHDSPEEYDKNNHVCDGRIPRLVARAYR
jgi:hypothetical protein